MSSCCARDLFVSPIDHDVESESIVQGGEIEQPLGQGGVPENPDTEEAGSSDDEDNNEAIPVNAAPRPNRPNKAEVDEHMLSHLPYRSWCAHCVKGTSEKTEVPLSKFEREVHKQRDRGRSCGDWIAQ